MFKVTRGKGFHITFANGWGISVQFGIGNYCENRNHISDPFPSDYGKAELEAGERGSASAEIAIMNPEGDLVHQDDWDDSVKGWVTPDDVLEIMNRISKL